MTLAFGSGAPTATVEVEVELAGQLMGVVDLMRQRFHAVIGPRELSPPQWLALRSLAMTGPIPMSALAGSLHCDASNVTGLTDRLEARGLVERQVDPADRRVKNLVLTPSGHEVVAEVMADLVDHAPASVLSPGDQQQLSDLLERLLRGNGVVAGLPGQPLRSC